MAIRKKNPNSARRAPLNKRKAETINVDDPIEYGPEPTESQQKVYETPFDKMEWNSKEDIVRGLGPAAERLARLICDSVLGEDSADLLSPRTELRRAASGDIVLKYGDLAPLWWKYEPAAKRVIEYYKQLLGA